jgi:hypothetical protein
MRVTYFNLELDPTFPYALFVILLNLVHYTFVNVQGGKFRKTHFSEEFMRQFKD